MATIALNPSAGQGVLSHTLDWTSGTEGAYYVQRFASDVLALMGEVFRLSGRVSGDVTRGVLKVSEVFDTGAGGLTIPCAIASTIEAGQKVQALRESGLSRSGSIDCFQKVTEAASFIASSAFMFVGSVMMKSCADFFAACADIGDVVIAGDDLASLNKIPAGKVVTKEAKAAVAEERTSVMMKRAKAIASVAIFVLGVLGLLLGAPLVPSLVLLALSVASGAFAVGKYFYDKNRVYDGDDLRTKLSQGLII